MVIVNILDKNYWNVWIAGTHYNTYPKVTRTVKDWCIAEKADLAYNLALFNFSDNKTVTYVHSPFGDIGYGGKSEVVYLNPANYCKGYSSGCQDPRSRRQRQDGQEPGQLRLPQRSFRRNSHEKRSGNHIKRRCHHCTDQHQDARADLLQGSFKDSEQAGEICETLCPGRRRRIHLALLEYLQTGIRS